jgi:DNA adenine methylase
MQSSGPTESSNRSRSVPRPVIKWAGGKTQLLPRLLRHVPEARGRYWEPFIGSAALFFELRRTGRIRSATLGDVNPELISLYTVIRDAVEALITRLGDHERHRHERTYYYEVRNWDRSPDWTARDPVERAARMIFLNKTCYNGLHRVNRRGEFNVPWGRYANPSLCDATNLRAASAALRDVELRVGHFRSLLHAAERGDVVYLDPPYVPVSTTASFTAYSTQPFGVEEHRELAATFAELVERGCHVVLSNSDTPLVRELYQNWAYEPVPARRAINALATARGPVSELIIVGQPAGRSGQ